MSFDVVVGGMPPGRYYIKCTPTPDGQAGIAISGLPANMAVSGYVTAAANGAGSGTLTITIVGLVPGGIDVLTELTQLVGQLFAN